MTTPLQDDIRELGNHISHSIKVLEEAESRIGALYIDVTGREKDQAEEASRLREALLGASQRQQALEGQVHALKAGQDTWADTPRPVSAPRRVESVTELEAGQAILVLNGDGLAITYGVIEHVAQLQPERQTEAFGPARDIKIKDNRTLYTLYDNYDGDTYIIRDTEPAEEAPVPRREPQFEDGFIRVLELDGKPVTLENVGRVVHEPYQTEEPDVSILYPGNAESVIEAVAAVTDWEPVTITPRQ